MKKLGKRYAYLKGKEKKGFTLIEIVVVIAIMAILALILVPNLTAWTQKADEAKVKANLKNIHTAAELVDKTEGNLTAEQVKLYSNVKDLEILDDFVEDTYTVDKDDTGQITIRYTSEKSGDHVFPNIDHNEGGWPEGPIWPVGEEEGLWVFDGQVLLGFNQNHIDSELGGVQPTEINIPSQREDGSPVTSIGASVFESYFLKKKLTSVVIPNSITYIGMNAFNGNNLTDVVIPDSVKIIGSSAFGNNNNLTSVKIGNSVTEIGIMAFADNKLTTLEIPDSVERIEFSAFANNQLTSVTIGNSVTFIGNGAFDLNPLTEVIIPNSVTEVEEGAFGTYSDQITGPGTWTLVFEEGWGYEWVN